MWELRTYLFLLDKYQRGQAKFLTPHEYLAVLTDGVSQDKFIKFAYRYWGLIPVMMLSLGLYKVSNDVVDGKKTHKEADYLTRLRGITRECKDKGFIECTNTERPKKIKILYPGTKFIQFAPFYKSLLKEYYGIVVALLSVVGTLAAVNYDQIIERCAEILHSITS